MQKVLVAMCAMIVVGACASANYSKDPGQTQGTISAQSSALVAVPQDGRYFKNVYTGSGAKTARIIADAFSKVLPQVETMATYADQQKSIEEARRLGKVYLIQPDILRWEDRATFWSGQRDQVSVRVRILEVASGKVVASGILDGSSRILAFKTYRPEDFLRKPAAIFATSVVK